MVNTRLLVTLSEDSCMGSISRSFPETTISILAAIPNDTQGFALAQLSGAESSELLAATECCQPVTVVSVIGQDETTVTAQLEVDEPLLLNIAQTAGVPISMPVDIKDGVVHIELTGDEERIAAFGLRLQDRGLSFDVEYIQRQVNPTESITDRQRELLDLAVERGYYAVPRETTLTELAEEFGIAKSTCSELLQRIEQTVVQAFTDGLPETDTDLRSMAGK